MKDKEKILKSLREIKREQSDMWIFGNKILYNMCSENPLNNKKEIVAGKVLLIGRSYAAALERARIEKSSEQIYDDFLNDVLQNSDIIDGKIKFLNEISLSEIFENLQNIFDLHSLLTSIMEKATGLEKRSLSSKYLHFHCPNAFFIYDSRARMAINALVKKQQILKYKGDNEYIEFYLRALELQNFIKNETGILLNPREIDDLLLYSGVL